MRRGDLHRSRGVALLIVLVVLVLIATLATEIAITSRTGYRMAGHSMEDLELRTAVDGRVEILKAALRYDATNGTGVDTEADEWAWHNHEKLSGWGERSATAGGGVTNAEGTQAAAAYRNTDVQLEAWCEDERSKLNLRGLVGAEDTPNYKNTREALIRLIDLFREGRSDLDLSEGDATEMVDDLVKWLNAEADSEDNPQPAVVDKTRGRLQSVDDLLRVPGGHWTAERLYDVKDPDVTEDENGAPVSSSSDSTGDAEWERVNGVPGLARYITVFADRAANGQYKVNINTASKVVLRALFPENDQELADKIVDHRREGSSDTSGTSSTGSSSSTSGSSSSTGTNDATQNFFKTKADLSKVDGVEQDLTRYPLLNYFADVTSNVYSIRVIGKILRQGSGDSAASQDPADENAPKDVDAILDYREVVQRTQAGFVTLFTERRNDPQFQK